ncbi:MAG: hypothetical protein WAX33_08810 [Rectinemataceae bacterium]
MKRKHIIIIIAILALCLVIGGCATVSPVPYNATTEQIQQINAKNIAATATNTSTLVVFQILSIIAGFLVSL